MLKEISKAYKVFLVLVIVVVLFAVLAGYQFIQFTNNSSESDQHKVEGFVQISYTKTCINGVVYLLTDSGISVKLNKQGQVEVCN
ncbi:TPA: hypothetical protein SFZ51_001596 [Campylobacter jejuni]|nr:hypothetical protein [Campylobacter jejuni]HEG8104708.1 hypothetical protein [Campylobacter jejuni]HEG8133566.1 hypothetical protein [Campylobacter jejuni]